MKPEVDTLVDKLRSTLETQSMLQAQGGLLIAGYSGGADSTAMLHALHTLQNDLRIRLHAAHLHHGIRPEADSDAEACRAFAESLNVPITIERIDVPEMAKHQKISLEEAGRQARYAFFERLASQTGACRIATAHTRDDRIETILINLLRGTGTRGLRGIPYQRGHIIRPLLDASREQTHTYCREHNLPVVFDITNLDPHQLRGRVRRELLPLMKDLSPAVEENLLRLAEIACMEEDYWEGTVQSLFRSTLLIQSNILHLDRFRELHLALQRRFLRELVMRYLPPGESLSFEMVDRMQKDIEDHQTSNWTFGKDTHIHIHPTLLSIVHKAKDVPELTYEYPCIIGNPLFIPEAEASVIVEEAPCSDKYYPASENEAWLAADAVQGKLYVRNRRTGDRLQPLGMANSRLVSDVMSDRKWDHAWRAVCPLLCDEAGILWVPGYRIADRAKIIASTKRFLFSKLIKIGLPQLKPKS
jgi:tRNA(Ile)-lysidine synthase